MMRSLPLYIVSGLAGMVALYAGLSGNAVWFIRDTRMAVIVLTAAGFLMCALGAIESFVTKAPAHPLTIVAYLLGLLALFAGVVHIFRLNVPFLQDGRTALIVITAVIIIKAVIARFAGAVIR